MQMCLPRNIFQMLARVLPFLLLCSFQQGIHVQSIGPIDPQMNACASNEELISVITNSGPFFRYDLPLQVELWTRTNGTDGGRYFSLQQDWLIGESQAKLRICVPKGVCLQMYLLEFLPANLPENVDTGTNDYAIFEEINILHETEGVLDFNGKSNGISEAQFFVETETCSAQALSSCSDDEFLLELEFNMRTPYSAFQWRLVNTYSDETVVSCTGGPDSECYNGGGNIFSDNGFRVARHCLPRSQCFQLVTGRPFAMVPGGEHDTEYLDIHVDGVLMQREEDLEFLALDIVLSSSICVLEDAACSYDESLLELFVQRDAGSGDAAGAPDLSWSIETSEKLEFFELAPVDSGLAPQEDSGIISVEKINIGLGWKWGPALLYFRKCVPRLSCSTLNLDMELNEMDYPNEYVKYQISIDGVQYGNNDYRFRRFKPSITAHAGESCVLGDVCDPSYNTLLTFEVRTVLTPPPTPTPSYASETEEGIGVTWRVFNADVEQEWENERFKPGTTTRQFICITPYTWSCSFFGIQGDDGGFAQIEDYRVWIDGVELYYPETCGFSDGGNYCYGYTGHFLGDRSCYYSGGSASPWVDEETEFLSSGAALGLFIFAMAIIVVVMIVLYRRSQNLRHNSTGNTTGATATPSGASPSIDDAVAVLVPVGKPKAGTAARLDATISDCGEDHNSFQKGSEGGDEDSHC